MSASSTELYDPVANLIVPGPNMRTARYTFSTNIGTLLANGKVLIVGGTNGIGPTAPVLATTELYDPATNTFAKTTPNMNVARDPGTLTLLPNGKVIIFGGGSGIFGLNSTELYDTASNSFAPAAMTVTLPTSFFGSATLLPNGMVLACCGDILNGGNLTVLYNPGSNTITFEGRANLNTYGSSTMTLLPNGKVLLAQSDPATDMGLTLNGTDLYAP